MLLLRLLEEKDMYGYEMIETLESRSNHVFSLKAGTLYPLLHSLEEKRYLRSYEDEVNGKTRKYYSITKEGRKYLQAGKRNGGNTRRLWRMCCMWEGDNGRLYQNVDGTDQMCAGEGRCGSGDPDAYTGSGLFL